MATNHSSGYCANCGADKGIHQCETMRCPRYGKEESRFDNATGKFYPQIWEDTVFEDNGDKEFADKAITEYDRLKKKNALLMEALVKVVNWHSACSGISWMDAKDLEQAKELLNSLKK